MCLIRMNNSWEKQEDKLKRIVDVSCGIDLKRYFQNTIKQNQTKNFQKWKQRRESVSLLFEKGDIRYGKVRNHNQELYFIRSE